MSEPRPEGTRPAGSVDFARRAASFGRGGEGYFWDFGRELAALAQP